MNRYVLVNYNAKRVVAFKKLSAALNELHTKHEFKSQHYYLLESAAKADMPEVFNNQLASMGLPHLRVYRVN